MKRYVSWELALLLVMIVSPACDARAVDSIDAIPLGAGASRDAPCAGTRSDPSPCQELRPRESLNAQTLAIGGAPRLYRLTGLHPESAYEVRVSYPATNPADVRVRIVDPGVQNSKSGSRGGGLRQLLNVEKMVASARELAEVVHPKPGGGHPPGVIVAVWAEPSAWHRDGPAGAPRELVFNVVLEPMSLAGLVPFQALPVGLIALGCAYAALSMEPMLRELVWGDLVRRRGGQPLNSPPRARRKR